MFASPFKVHYLASFEDSILSDASDASVVQVRAHAILLLRIYCRISYIK